MNHRERIVQEMTELAKKGSDAINGEYCTVQLQVSFIHGTSEVRWSCYTEPRSWTDGKTFEEMAAGITANPVDLIKKAAELRAAAEKWEAMAKGGAK